MANIDQGMPTTYLTRAKLHVYNVCQQGDDIEIISSSSTDSGGSSLTESNLTLKAFPIRYTPYNRDTYLKISWAEDTDVLCYVSRYEIDNCGKSLLQIKKKFKEIRVNKKTYTLKYIEPYSSFGPDSLYIIFGGKI